LSLFFTPDVPLLLIFSFSFVPLFPIYCLLFFLYPRSRGPFKDSWFGVYPNHNSQNSSSCHPPPSLAPFCPPPFFCCVALFCLAMKVLFLGFLSFSDWTFTPFPPFFSLLSFAADVPSSIFFPSFSPSFPFPFLSFYRATRWSGRGQNVFAFQ